MILTVWLLTGYKVEPLAFSTQEAAEAYRRDQVSCDQYDAPVRLGVMNRADVDQAIIDFARSVGEAA